MDVEKCSMTSNYPPGVTGREYAISGPEAEVETEVVCGMKDITLRNLPQTSLDILMTARSKIVILTQHYFPPDVVPPFDEEREQIASEVYRLLERALRPVSEGATVDCPFEGEVTVSWYGGIGSWTCPCCGYDHEIQYDEPHDESEMY
jgi:hypothetical protein